MAKNSGVRSLEQLHKKRVLTPQLANTQDVTARAFFSEKNIAPSIYPVSNPDQINLFRKGNVAAAWTVEPWVSRLVNETGATILFDEREIWKNWTGSDYATTLIVVRRSFLEEHRGLVLALVRTHVQITKWMDRNPSLAQAICNRELEKLLGKPLPEETLRTAWNRIKFTWDPAEKSLKKYAANAGSIGFLIDGTPDVSGLFVPDILRQVLEEL